MEISTSILGSKNRIEDIIKLNRTNTSYIHIDVMDGKFVSDIQFKINEISAVNRVTKYPMDIHLMVNDPISYIAKLKNMNISYITFHLEIRKSKEKIISKIKEMGYKVGLSIKPNTDIEKLKPYLKDIDLILIMSVEPGRGGQKFLDGTIDRIKEVKKLIDEGGYDIKIEVDGGINDETITKLDGVDIAVVGSYIIKGDNYYNRLEKIRNLYNHNLVNNKTQENSFMVNFLIELGLLLMFLSACIELSGHSFLYSISKYFVIFLVGFICFSLGLFRKNIFYREKEKLKRQKLFYEILLVIGILPFILIGICFLSLVLLEKFTIFNSLFTTFIFAFLYWPIYLLAFLFVVVGIVRLSEIKRLS